MSNSVTRRDVLRRLSITGGALVGTGALGAAIWTPSGDDSSVKGTKSRVYDFRIQHDDPSRPQMTVAKNLPSPAALVRKAVEALGGMKRFITDGDVVALKPNIGWDRSPIHAANTNPDLVKEVIRLAYEAGAARVIVTDSSCNDPQRTFERSGIWEAAYSAGAEVILPAQYRFRTIRMKGKLLDEWPILSPVIDADKVINLPIAKQHNLAKFTGAMKNWYGLLGGRRNRLHQAIDVSIADLAAFLRPTLTVMDATRVLIRNGPQGGNIADTRRLNTVVVSVDQVAVDAFGCTLIGEKPEHVRYLRIAQSRGIGFMDLKRIRVREV